MLNKLTTIDRRLIFALVALAVIIPFVTRLTMGIRVSTPVKKAYDAVDRLEPGSIILLAIDYDPASMPELQPMLMAILRHAFEKKLKVIFIGLWPLGPPLGHMAMEEISKEFNLKYGEDYAFLDYRPGGSAVILAIGRNLKSIYGSDYKGIPLDSLPITKNVTNYDDIALVVDLAAGSSADWWPQLAAARYGQNVIIGCTAVVAPTTYTYFGSNQIQGLIGGLKGASEYETLVKRLGTASLGMSAQSVTHALIVLLIIIGNLAYFTTRRRSK